MQEGVGVGCLGVVTVVSLLDSLSLLADTIQRVQVSW